MEMGRRDVHPPAWREGRVGALQLKIGGAPGRSKAQPTYLPFRRERTCDPKGRVRERRQTYICLNRCV
jgi:hypothetical protein